MIVGRLLKSVITSLWTEAVLCLAQSIVVVGLIRSNPSTGAHGYVAFVGICAMWTIWDIAALRSRIMKEWV